MASDPLTPDELVVPNPGPAKVIGVLNIVFALAGMLMGLCCSVYTLMLPGMGPAMQAQQQQLVKSQKAMREAQVARLREEEKQAPTEEGKAQVRAQIQALESAPLDAPPEIDFAKLGLTDPRFLGHFGLDLASNLVLNVLMFIAGIGLLGVKEWGRALGVWVAALKVVRLLALTASLVFVVIPFMTQKAGAIGDLLKEQEAAQKGQPAPGMPGPDPAQVVQAITGMATGYAVGLLILGSIYPAIALVVLTRPGVKAAFQKEDRVSW